MVNLEGLREAITRAGQGQLGCRCPASEDPMRRNMTKRGTVKLSGILGFWRRNRSSVERRINNLGTCQGAD